MKKVKNILKVVGLVGGVIGAPHAVSSVSNIPSSQDGLQELAMAIAVVIAYFLRSPKDEKESK